VWAPIIHIFGEENAGASIPSRAKTVSGMNFSTKICFPHEMCQSGLGDFRKKWDIVIFFREKGAPEGEDVY
jgi:hypothetical protein